MKDLTLSEMYKRLGALDHERRNIINRIKIHPEYGKKALIQYLRGELFDKKPRFFEKDSSEKTSSSLLLRAFKFESFNETSISSRKIGANTHYTFTVTLNFVCVENGITKSISRDITLTKDIVPQIFMNMKELDSEEVKKIIEKENKRILKEKQKIEIYDEILRIKQDSEKTIEKLQKRLDALK